MSILLSRGVQTLLPRPACKQERGPHPGLLAECTGRAWILGPAECFPGNASSHVVLGSVVCTAGHLTAVLSGMWKEGKDSWMNKHLHSLMPHGHDHCRLNRSLWQRNSGKENGHITTHQLFFQVTGSLSGLDNLITYYGLCGGSLFKQG